MTANPWGDRPSIYGHIRASLDLSTGVLAPSAEALPDDGLVERPGGIGFVAGAVDGILGSHAAGGRGEAAAGLLAALREAALRPGERGMAAFYELARRGGIGGMDAFLEAVVAAQDIPAAEVRRLALWLATGAPDRAAVKLGLALLGLFQGGQDREVLMTLGSHDEFSLYSVVALRNSDPAPVEAVWELARRVKGWGRVQAVSRLPGTDDPRIKDWLLREGWSNTVMVEYLAYTCATRGGLLEALERGGVDDGLLEAASELIEALFNGGPAEDIRDYEDGARAVELFLARLESGAWKLRHALAAYRVRGFVADEGFGWAAMAAMGWTPERRRAMVEACDRVLDRPGWRALVFAGAEAGPEQDFWLAREAAKALGVDIWARLWQRLEERPGEPARWRDALEARDGERFGRVLGLAERSLPLDAVASGPAMELGLGPGFEPHQCLDWLLAALKRYPGRGWRLISAGLRSPVTRNRNLALDALKEWDRGAWPAEAAAALRDAAAAEPDARVKDRLAAAIEDRQG